MRKVSDNELFFWFQESGSGAASSNGANGHQQNRQKTHFYTGFLRKKKPVAFSMKNVENMELQAVILCLCRIPALKFFYIAQSSTPSFHAPAIVESIKRATKKLQN